MVQSVLKSFIKYYYKLSLSVGIFPFVEHFVGLSNVKIKSVYSLFFQQNKWLLKADADSDNWNAYVDYIDEIVSQSLYEIIEFNLNYLLEESDPTLNKRPLFEVQLILKVIDVINRIYFM